MRHSVVVAIRGVLQADWICDAVVAGGGVVGSLENATALVWTGGNPVELAEVLAHYPAIEWVQVPAAGVENYGDYFNDGRIWTSAKGAFSRQTAEHALTLLLAGLRGIAHFARAHTWLSKAGRPLHGAHIMVVGGGGVGEEFVHLLSPFGCRVTVVRRRRLPVAGATTVVTLDMLPSILRVVDAVVLCAPLTDRTRHLIGETELRTMRDDAWLVNVARGELVVTPDLVRALQDRCIGGAALDVTDPEPLPSDHPLWRCDNCLITPHTANPSDLERRDLSQRIRDNTARRVRGESLIGVIDSEFGY
jgi:phosphoglycerate dehydrogenase-like enzyme